MSQNVEFLKGMETLQQNLCNKFRGHFARHIPGICRNGNVPLGSCRTHGGVFFPLSSQGKTPNLLYLSPLQ